jgi:hypothetical protein
MRFSRAPDYFFLLAPNYSHWQILIKLILCQKYMSINEKDSNSVLQEHWHNSKIFPLFVFFLICAVGLWGPAATVGLFIVPAPDDRWWWLWRNWWNEDWQGKPKYSENTCPSATLSTTNPTWLDPGLNPDRHGGKPATNRLSYGAAIRLSYSYSIKQVRQIAVFGKKVHEAQYSGPI